MKIIIILSTLLVLASCGSNETTTREVSGNPESTQTTTQTTTANNQQPSATDPSGASQCGALGRFAFITVSDNDRHFDAIFDQNGIVRYLLNGSPTGTYTVSESQVAFVGPFGRNSADLTLTWDISMGSGCDIRQLRGTSPAGTRMVANRI